MLHVCAIKTEGTITCWGNNGRGQTTPATSSDAFVDITSGREFSCARTSVGAPYCWGRNYEGQTSIPGALASVKQIDAGAYHACAIETDDTVRCWGENVSGESTPPIGLGTVKRVAAGEGHTCAIKTDDTVQCWGSDFVGQSTPPPDLGTVLALDSGAHFSCAITTTGELRCWGTSGNGVNSPPYHAGSWSAIPDAPILTSTSPGSPGSSLAPAVLGSAWPDALIQLYASADCSGSVEGGATSAQLASGGITVPVAADATTAISAKVFDGAGNWSECSNGLSYTHATPPPPPAVGPPAADPPPTTPDPPTVLPPAPGVCSTTPNAPRAKRSALALNVRLAEAKLRITAKARGRVTVIVTAQPPCASVKRLRRTTKRASGRVELAIRVPRGAARGTLYTVTVSAGSRRAVATATAR